MTTDIKYLNVIEQTPVFFFYTFNKMDNHLNMLYILVCLKYTWGMEDMVGGNLSVAGYKNSENTEEYGYLATSPEYEFPYCGTIKRWRIHLLDKGTLWLQVWRPQKVMNYRLVQETPVHITEVPINSEQVISVATPEIIHFVKGDVIGWKYKKKELIPSRPSPSMAGGRGFWRIAGSNIPEDLVNWGQGEFVYGRQYAISAVISQNTSPFFEKGGRRVSGYTVAIDDATDLYSPMVNVQARDADDNVTLKVSMETESVHFKFNETSHQIYTVHWLRTGQYSLAIKATDPCGQSVSAQVTIIVVESNPTTTQETFLGKPAIVWKVGLPMSLGLSVICLGGISLYSCIQWKRGKTFPASLDLY